MVIGHFSELRGEEELMSESKREGEYKLIEIPGKHGRIKLMVPSRSPSKQELNRLYKTIAGTIINAYKNKA